MNDDVLAREAVELRRAAARKYQPERVRLLLVAEAPPTRLSRYFYFEDVEHHDDLFWNVAKAMLRVVMTDRSEKPKHLTELQQRGVFLVDLKCDPLDPAPYSSCVDSLIERCEKLGPDKIILIKMNVYDTAFASLRLAGLPVINKRIPFPGSGHQLKFATAFAQALEEPPPAPPLLHAAG